MKSGRAGGWVAGTVFLIVVIWVGVFFLGVSPRMDATASTLDQIQSTRGQNEILELQTAKLRADFANLEQYRAEVAALQVQIPADGRLADYTRALDAAAVANGVVITEITPGTPSVVVLPAPVVPPPTDPVVPDEGTDEAEEPAEPTDPGTDGPAAPPIDSGQIEGFVSIPMVVTVVGAQANVWGFLAQVQSGSERLTLVTQLLATRLGASAESGGRPAVEDGDLELTVNGLIYTLLPPATGVPPVTEEVPTVPLPTSDRNPFIPLAF